MSRKPNWWGIELDGGSRVIVCLENKPPEDQRIAFKESPITIAAGRFRVVTEAMTLQDAQLWVDKLAKVE